MQTETLATPETEPAPVSEASTTVAEPEAQLEAPRAVEPAALPELPAPAGTLLGNGVSPSVAPPPEASSVRPPALDALGHEALARLRTEGGVSALARAALGLAGVILAFRFVFDDAFPRLVLVALVGASAVAAVVVVAQSLAEARRRRAVLQALTQIVELGRAHPQSLDRTAVMLDRLVSALERPDAPVSSSLPIPTVTRDAAETRERS